MCGRQCGFANAVMARLVPAIHDFAQQDVEAFRNAWMPATSAGMTVMASAIPSSGS